LKIAIIGDIHANLPALEAVVKDARSRGADIFINTGDYSGYGPFPDETIEMAKDLEIASVRGNYDNKVLQVYKKLAKWEKTKRMEKWQAFKWAYDNLSLKNRLYLASLPEICRFEVSGKKFLLTHGSPASISEHISAETPEDRLLEIADISRSDFVITGHSHSPFNREISNTRFINPGSVGRPDDGDPRGSYAILEISYNTFDLSHYRIDYDIKATVSAIREKGLPGQFCVMFMNGLKLDDADPPEEKDEPDPHAGEEKSDPYTDHRIMTIEKAMEQMEITAPLHAHHCRHVAGISLQLFDQLLFLHRLGDQARYILECAAHLHDIGWIYGQKGHHKTSLSMIHKMQDIFPDPRERNLVASVARYHRRSFPRKNHKHYGMLTKSDRKMVDRLSAILRIADGLDWDHVDNVRKVLCETKGSDITISCFSDSPSTEEKEKISNKSALFEKVFKRKVGVKWYQA